MFKNLFLWVFPPKPERKPMSSNEMLLLSIRATALSRYRAFSRVKLQDKVAFLTNIIVSLGLVFIPMMQNAKINLAFPDSVLNMMQRGWWPWFILRL